MRKLLKGVTLTTLATMLASSIGCGGNNIMSPEMIAGFNTTKPIFGLTSDPHQLAYYAAKKSQKKVDKKWSIFVYLGADNNLYTAGLDDINEMEAGLSSEMAKNVNVIVLFDGEEEGDSVLYKIIPDKDGKNQTIISEKIDDKGEIIPSSGEVDSGNKETFKKFLMWGVANYPAQNYMVDVWDHGSGLFLKSQVPFHKVFVSDDQSGNHMQTKDLNYVLPDVVKLAGKKIDVLGFDACLMGHVELAYQVKDYVNYYVASEETEPGDGWDYMGWFKRFSQNTRINGATLASHLVDSYVASYSPGGSQSNGYAQKVTLAATNLNALTGILVPAINQFGNALNSSLPDLKSTLSTIRASSETYYNSDCTDIYHFAELVTKNTSIPENIKVSAKSVMDGINKSVIREGHVGFKNSHGLVMYFPYKSWHTFNPKYTNPSEVLFAETKSWGNFLQNFLKK